MPAEPELRKQWKTTPIRISGRSRSPCCRVPTFLVQSMEGGFVTRNCSKCGEKDTLPEDVFMEIDLWVECPECRERMNPTMIRRNYGYVCPSCHCEVFLAELIPSWQDIVG
jgi:NAD-dependent SIR2 family protein deacetylase